MNWLCYIKLVSWILCQLTQAYDSGSTTPRPSAQQEADVCEVSVVLPRCLLQWHKHPATAGEYSLPFPAETFEIRQYWNTNRTRHLVIHGNRQWHPVHLISYVKLSRHSAQFVHTHPSSDQMLSCRSTRPPIIVNFTITSFITSLLWAKKIFHHLMF